MSVLRYNGVTLPYVQTLRFEQRAVEDESHTDWYCTEFDITVQSLLHADYFQTIVPDYYVSGSEKYINPADVMRIIRMLLLERRRSFSFKVNNAELIPQPQQGIGGTVDAQNGPVPQSCVLTQLTASSFILTYHIKARYWESNSHTITGTSAPSTKNLAGNAVLYNRWRESVRIDNCMRSTKTRSGKFVIRSDNTSGFIVDQLRSQFAVVSVPAGFLRQSAEYIVSPDGLALEYIITDVEYFKIPPDVAFEASGEYMETVQGGTHRSGEVFVRLKGTVLTNQARLMEAAIFIALEKVHTANTLLGPVMLENAQARMQLWENTVDFRLRVMLQPREDRVSQAIEGKIIGIAGYAGLGTGTPISDPDARVGGGLTQTSLDYDDRGTASLLLRAAAYYDPTLIDAGLGDSSIRTTNRGTTIEGENSQFINPGKQPGQAGKRPEA